MQTSQRNSDGFTLVEVLMAMLIMVVGLLGLLQSADILTETSLKNQLREESAQVGEKVLNDLMVSKDAAFDRYSTRIGSGLRGVSKDYKVTGRRDDIAGTSSQLVSVTVSWTYRGEVAQHLISATKTKQ